jgi:hypothetical protein
VAGVSVFVVAIVSSVVIAVVLTALGYLVVRLVGAVSRRMGGTVGSRVLTGIGVVISLAGLIGLVWTQSQQVTLFGPVGFGDGGAYRWELAMEPIMVIGIGLLVSIAAQVLRTVQLGQVVRDIEEGPLES